MLLNLKYAQQLLIHAGQPVYTFTQVSCNIGDVYLQQGFLYLYREPGNHQLPPAWWQ